VLKETPIFYQSLKDRKEWEHQLQPHIAFLSHLRGQRGNKAEKVTTLPKARKRITVFIECLLSTHSYDIN
jgi:hypothetical protein